MAEGVPVADGEMRRSLSLTGITVNAMALIAPGAFLWTTFQLQAAQSVNGATTAADTWSGLGFALVLALLTAYSYSQLAKIYPDAGTGSSYYFAEAALLEKESPKHRSYARVAKLSVGWISHLYYWLYPGIMVGFTATLFNYIYKTIGKNDGLDYKGMATVAILFTVVVGYVAFRGISGSTMTAIVINVIQIVSLVAVGIIFITYRMGHGHEAYDLVNASKVVIPHSFLNMIYQSTIAILLLVGFESVTALGAEALRPEKDIQRGILLSLIIQGGMCYLFEYFATNFAVGGATITGTDASGAAVKGYGAAAVSGAPIGDMLKTIGDRSLGHTGTTISLIVAMTVLLALIGTTLACLNTGVRVTYAMAKDKEMPGLLSLLHGRFATPHGGILVLTAVTAVIGVYCATPYQVDNITQVTVASNTGTFLVYGASCIVTIVAFSHRHDKHWFKHYVIPALGLLMNVAELVGIVYLAIKAGGATAKDAVKSIEMVVAWVVVGVLWVKLNPNKRGHKIFSHADQKEVRPASVA